MAPPPTIDIKLAPTSDLTIKVIESTETGLRVAHMHVSKKLLMKNSRYFQAMFKSCWADSADKVIVIKDYTVKSIELWLRIFHKMPTDFSDSVSSQDAWYAVKAYDYYGFRRTKLAVWLKSYYMALGLERFTSATFLSQLLLPYYFLGNASCFQHLTKAIVYRTVDYISDEFPLPEDQINLPSHIDMPGRVIQQLVSARRRLRSVLQESLVDIPLSWQKTRTCNSPTASKYCQELNQIGVVSGEKIKDDMSVSEVLNRLKTFRTAWVRPIQHDIEKCESCKDYLTLVPEVRERVEKYFQGLCLDCMQCSKKLTAAEWRQSCGIRPSEDCKIDHGYPTRHFSFMGTWGS